VRTGYSAIADEWIPIRPGTDGALFMALLHELLAQGLVDRSFLQRFTNAPQLVVLDEGEREGLFAFDPAAGPPGDGRHPHNKLAWDLASGRVVQAYPEGVEEGRQLALEGHYKLADGTRVAPAFQLLRDRVADTTPEWAEDITGIPSERIRQLAREVGETALHQAFELPIPWTDAWGKRHPTTQGRPVAFHAMRGLAAHSNGFQTVRALAVLMSVLGTIDAPGGFRHKAPYPRHIVPNYRAFNDPSMIKPNTPLNAAPLGFPAGPDELAVHEDGTPLRIDHAFSWEHPLSAHGMMHNVITNAVRGDPYEIDTLLIFMANMAWNSTMNTMEVRKKLNARGEDGEYKIPFLVVCDAFQSEMVAFADLVLPDTTYLERHDVMSMLDRPISEYDGPVDSVRVPVVEPTGNCKPFQEVLIELASRLKFPAFTREDGTRKFKDYPDFVVNFQAQPGVGFLMGWRGKDGKEFAKGAPNPNQLKEYIKNGSFYLHHLPENMRYFKHANRDYLDWANSVGFIADAEQLVFQLYMEPMQRFRLAAQGKSKMTPPELHRERIETYFDPLPFWYQPIEGKMVDEDEYPMYAITQRPMHMYHSWGSQNAWLRQITADNRLYMSRNKAKSLGIVDDDWVWVSSRIGRVRAQVRLMDGVNDDTVWTWNAIGKRSGAWGLTDDAPENTRGFLLNHLIGELLPEREGGYRYSNSDPVTGQAAWYDLKVRIEKAKPDEPHETSPRFEPLKRPPGTPEPIEVSTFGAEFRKKD